MNTIIIDQFKKLIKQIQFDIDHSSSKKDKIGNTFRLKNIKNAVKIISLYKKEITSGKDLENYEGIGKGIMQRIDEIIETGKLSEIKEDILNDKYIDYIEELEGVYGIGRQLALELFTVYNVKSIKQLKELYQHKKIELPDTVVKGLKYYGLIDTIIPREEIDEMSNILVKILTDINKNLFGLVCGSYRRLQPTSGDIDFLIIHPKNERKYFKLFIDKLFDAKIMIDSFTSSDVHTKFMGICQLQNKPLRRIDIRFIPFESYYSAVLYFTGSGEFNRKMRQVAIDQHYTLNEYGLYDSNGKAIKIKSEKDIFDKLNMEYLSPNMRNS